ncbi:glycosyltransferase [Sphingobacterium sp. ML3W]|uniref:glycosyltransferase n=1 Tax=Sphingobacterium sp. ML3W TaxID=1538644 RepID=UPI00249B84D9|nr:glycosyltransferase [Sphingobacterium sp. ML3W]WFA78896.1 glycosyltransferase [Sphingobacterium sp. ML3W]
MKILLVQHLCFLNGIGGTEKICSTLANIFNEHGHEVEIATNENVVGMPVFPLSEGIKVTNIFDPAVEQKKEFPIYNYRGKNPFLWLKFKAKKKYHKWYNWRLKYTLGGEAKLYQYNLRKRSIAWNKYIDQLKPDLIVTMSISSLLEITFGNSLPMPIINSVNGRPDYDYSNIWGGRKPYMVDLLTHSYRYLDGIQILFDSYRRFLPSDFSGECRVIANPIELGDCTKLAEHSSTKERYKIIHVGRLDTACKQQHLAIELFNKLAKKYTQWDLEFWGTGADFNRLNEQILDLDLSDRIFLRGFTEDPIGKMKDADIFIFPSQYEGFSLALGEAMGVGLPSIGFSACSGVNEMIKQNKTGFLALNKEEMLIYLEKLIQDSSLRQQMGIKAHLSMKDYNLDQMVKGWMKLIDTVITKKGI